MKTIGLLLLLSATAFAQRAGYIGPRGFNSTAYARPNSFGSITGFGNVVHPGTGHAPPLTGSITDTTFGLRLGATVSGFPPYTGVPAGGGRRRGGGAGGGVVYVPYPVSYPVYSEPEPQMVMMYPQQQMNPSPQVVINQNFTPETARPVMQEYVSDSAGGIRVYDPQTRVAPAAPAVEEARFYLIAFKDHTIYAALAYWVEGDTLHYVTNQNTHNQVSLDLIDRELSNRLNRERNVDFRLPAERR